LFMRTRGVTRVSRLVVLAGGFVFFATFPLHKIFV
jgi:hypothetical protein